jgi:bifunctional DNase/RNase
MIQRGGEVVSVDARPSDSIAIALRLKAPIYASDELLGPPTLHLQQAEPGSTTPETAPELPGPGGGLSAEQLKEYLKGLKPEDLGRFNP